MMDEKIQITKRQHYVCRCYLQNWRNDEKIWCRDKQSGKDFFSNLMGVAQEKFFYETEQLSDTHIEFIHKLWLKDQKSPLLEQNIGWLSLFCQKDQIINLISKVNDNNDSDHLIKYLKTNFEEKMYADLERNFAEILRKLIVKDSSFFDEDKQIELLFTLCLQYFRTKDKEEAIINAGLKGEFENTINATRWILANTLAYNIYCSKDYKIIFVENNTAIPFITSDQPILNIYAGLEDRKNVELQHEELEFYYPLNTQKALIVSFKEVYTNFQTIYATEIDVKNYNILQEKLSYQFIYAANKQDLYIQ